MIERPLSKSTVIWQQNHQTDGCDKVLQPKCWWRRGLGNLQLHIWLDQLGDLWNGHLVQSVLACCHFGLSRHEV